jgi:hypothetical protein
MVNEAFHGPPCVEESHAFVDERYCRVHPAAPGRRQSKCKWSVDEVEIHEADSEPVPTRLKRLAQRAPADGW